MQKGTGFGDSTPPPPRQIPAAPASSLGPVGETQATSVKTEEGDSVSVQGDCEHSLHCGRCSLVLCNCKQRVL